jgi:hypothetical protein
VHFGDVNIHWIIILTCIFKKYGVRVWAGFSSVRFEFLMAASSTLNTEAAYSSGVYPQVHKALQPRKPTWIQPVQASSGLL